MKTTYTNKKTKKKGKVQPRCAAKGCDVDFL